MMILTILTDFNYFILEIPVLGKTWSKKMKMDSLSWNLVLRLFGTIIIFVFSAFDRKYSVLGNLFQKIKIVCWNWKLVLRLIQICRIWRWFSDFFFLDRKYSFWVNLVQKLKIVILTWNLSRLARLFRIQKIRSWCSIFLF